MEHTAAAGTTPDEGVVSVVLSPWDSEFKTVDNVEIENVVVFTVGAAVRSTHAWSLLVAL